MSTRSFGIAATAFTTALVGGVSARHLPPAGYASQPLDATDIVAPAPQPDDARWQSDRAIFRATRRLIGSPRWVLATNDVREDDDSMMRDFSCAAGLTLTPTAAPHTIALLRRAAIDTAGATDRAKLFYKHARPFTLDPGPTCQPIAEVSRNYDYPSGHSTRGWTWALLLARLLPDRAGPIVARGRSFGESRIVCGVHNSSAVEAARAGATYALAAIDAVPTFRHDVAGARRELVQLRGDADRMPPDAATCAAEARLIGRPIT